MNGWTVVELCISQFQLHPAPPPPPPGYCGAFARLVSPGDGAFANFVLPGAGHLPTWGPTPSFWHARGFLSEYRKIPKISLTFWGSSFWRGLSTEGNLRFKINWASLIVGREFTVLPGGLYLEGRFNWAFFVFPVWGAYIYTWRGLLIWSCSK